MDKYQNYFDGVKYIEGLSNIQRITKKNKHSFSIERTKYFLKLLNNPEKNIKFIHVTGTSGKGTVCSIIQNNLTAQGFKTGLFISPFVTSTVERIQIDGKYIKPNDFVNILEKVKPAIDIMFEKCPFGGPIYFEILFAISLIYFKQKECDFVVLEVGIGGTYDSTNIIENPLVTAITNIDFDHMELLGNTLRKIAIDKSGIIKKGSQFFTTEKRNNICKVFEEKCRLIGAKYNHIEYENGFDEANKVLAFSVCESLGLEESKLNIPKRLPARFEIISKKPMIILDGAHNEAKIRSVIEKLKKIEYKRLFVLFAISDGKEYKKCLNYLINEAYKITATRYSILGRKVVNPAEIIRVIKNNKNKKVLTEIKTDPIKAFQDTVGALKKGDIFLITGSFFLTSDIRKLFVSEVEILDCADREVSM
ncbi:MAG: Mur ligase family protein [Candidatus Taylorbacteria bacterium]|nr:Mur ligase family protein [Candidatus Taylorbacteria bacterium]